MAKKVKAKKVAAPIDFAVLRPTFNGVPGADTGYVPVGGTTPPTAADVTKAQADFQVALTQIHPVEYAVAGGLSTVTGIDVTQHPFLIAAVLGGIVTIAVYFSIKGLK